MKNESNIVDFLQTHYFKRDNFSTLQEMLYTVSEKYKDKTAFVLKDNLGSLNNITYYNFVRDVESVGISLINYGFKNKKIAIIGKNSYKWAVTYLAASIVGVVVPIDKELSHEDVINFLNISEASVLLGDDKNLKDIYANLNKIDHEIFFVNFDLKSNNDIFYGFDSFRSAGLYHLDNDQNPFRNIQIDPDEMHILLFTSGMTGNSKGVCLSHKNICSNIFSIGSIVKVDTSTSILSILPIHHTYECTLGFLLVISSGGKIAYCDGLKHLADNLSEYKPNIILSVPLLLEKLNEKIVKSLQNSFLSRFSKKINI